MPYQFQQTQDARFFTLVSSVGGNINGANLFAAAPNAKGAWTNVGSPTPYTAEMLNVRIYQASAAANFLVDIGIKTTAGSVQTLLENLNLPSLSTVNQGLSDYGFPIHVPRSSQLVGRAQCTTSGLNLVVAVHAAAANPWGIPGRAKAYTLGVNSANSRGTTLDTGGVANTKTGSFVVIHSAVPANLKAFLIAIGNGGDVSRTGSGAGLFDVAVGPVGSETTILPNFPWMFESTRDSPSPYTLPIMPCDIKSGTRISARQQCTNNTAGDRGIDIIIYGLP